MAFVNDINSTDSETVVEALFVLLNNITDPDVLSFDNQYYSAADPHKFLEQFESDENNAKPLQSPLLLKKWSQYIWVRIELLSLGHQKAYLNYKKMLRQENQKKVKELALFYSPTNAQPVLETKNKNSLPPALRVPATPHTVARAIQEDAENGIPIETSIEVMLKMVLQIIDTEHPTDPLSPPARKAVIHITDLLSAENPNEGQISESILTMLHNDSIPPTQRTVLQEIHRGLAMTSKILYRTLPAFIRSIIDAYQTFYPDKYEAFSESIFEALEGGIFHGVEFKPLVRDGRWPGFDRDGNPKVFDKTMIDALRLGRVRVCEDHVKCLQDTVIHSAKLSERTVRKKVIGAFASPHFAAMAYEPFREFTVRFMQYFDVRNFTDGVTFLKNKKNELETESKQTKHAKTADKIADCIKVLDSQIADTEFLIQLTAFSGTYLDNGIKANGALDNLQIEFENYIDQIRESDTDIQIIDDKGVKHDASRYMFDKYKSILNKFKDIFVRLPELYVTARIFGIQLKSYGLTYGVAHVRQESAIFTKVWSDILEDLKSDKEVSGHPVFQYLGSRKYIKLTHDEQLHVQRLIQSSTEISILKRVLHLYEFDYKNSKKYIDNKDFSIVCRELDCIKLAAENQDVIENIIIATFRAPVHYTQMISFLKIFNIEINNLVIVPLLEEVEDLMNYEAITKEIMRLTLQEKLSRLLVKKPDSSLLKALELNSFNDIQHFAYYMNENILAKKVELSPEFKKFLAAIEIEIMVGYSDSSRVSGLSSLIVVKETREGFEALVQAHFMSTRVYHGPGSNYVRGGAKRRDAKATLQGEGRRLIATDELALDYRETQFYLTHDLLLYPERQKEFLNMPPRTRKLIDEAAIAGIKYYELLHNPKNALGILLGYWLAQNFMVSITNSSSRLTERPNLNASNLDIKGDRTNSVQTGGIRPPKNLNVSGPRAISAMYYKELLRANMDYLGPIHGLKSIGLDNAIHCYKSSETVRDMFHKVLVGMAMCDLSVAAYSLFANDKTFLPENREQRQEWAKDCLTLEPFDIEELLQSDSGTHTVKRMLAKLFALITEEIELTKEFMFEMVKRIYPKAYLAPDAPVDLSNPLNLLHHLPELKNQIERVILCLQPASVLLARMTHHVSAGKNLDDVYQNLNNEASEPDRKLTPVGQLIANVGTTTMAGLVMQPAFTEILLSYKDNLPEETVESGLEITASTKTYLKTYLDSKVAFFGKTEAVNGEKARVSNGVNGQLEQAVDQFRMG